MVAKKSIDDLKVENCDFLKARKCVVILIGDTAKVVHFLSKGSFGLIGVVF